MKFLPAFALLFFSLTAVSLERPPICAEGIALRPSLPDVWTKMFNLPETDGDVDGYLTESGAESDYRSFQVQPGSPARGEPRLVIKVSPASYPLYLKYFNHRHILENIAVPNNQAYNVVRWRNETFLGAAAAAFPAFETIGLPILISESEAINVHKALYIIQRYFKANYLGYQYPYHVPGYGFPDLSHYRNCAAWLGLLMIGDQLCTQIVGPGNVEPNTPPGPPIVGNLTPYQVPAEIVPEDQELFREVFSVPGHQPLWEALGFSLAEGDFTASGWFAHTLLGRAPLQRLPIVVYYTQDHRTPIPEIVNPQIHLIGWRPLTAGPDGLH
jgi:hypothetical protein